MNGLETKRARFLVNLFCFPFSVLIKPQSKYSLSVHQRGRIEDYTGYLKRFISFNFHAWMRGFSMKNLETSEEMKMLDKIRRLNKILFFFFRGGISPVEYEAIG